MRLDRAAREERQQGVVLERALVDLKVVDGRACLPRQQARLARLALVERERLLDDGVGVADVAESVRGKALRQRLVQQRDGRGLVAERTVAGVSFGGLVADAAKAEVRTTGWMSSTCGLAESWSAGKASRKSVSPTDSVGRCERAAGTLARTWARNVLTSRFAASASTPPLAGTLSLRTRSETAWLAYVVSGPALRSP